MPLKEAQSGAAANSPVRVLQISDDPELAESRALLLASAGFIVEQCATWQLRTHTRLDRFDIFFLCQSIDPQSAGEVAIRVRREAPRARILRIRAKRADHDHLANFYLSAPAAPHELVHAVEFLASTLPAQRHRTQDA